MTKIACCCYLLGSIQPHGLWRLQALGGPDRVDSQSWSLLAEAVAEPLSNFEISRARTMHREFRLVFGKEITENQQYPCIVLGER